MPRIVVIDGDDFERHGLFGMSVNPNAVGVTVVDDEDIMFGVVVTARISPLDFGEGVALFFQNGPLFGLQGEGSELGFFALWVGKEEDVGCRIISKDRSGVVGIDAGVVADFGPFVFLKVVGVSVWTEDADEGFGFGAVSALLLRAWGEVEIEGELADLSSFVGFEVFPFVVCRVIGPHFKLGRRDVLRGDVVDRFFEFGNVSHRRAHAAKVGTGLFRLVVMPAICCGFKSPHIGVVGVPLDQWTVGHKAVVFGIAARAGAEAPDDFFH